MARELWVGPAEQYGSVRDAAAAAQDGDTIYVRAGVYENDFSVIRSEVSIIGVGGQAHFKATVAPPNGKAIFVTNDNVTVENLAFSGTRVPDGNGAGIRHQAGDLTIRNSYFEDNQNGILTISDPGMRVLIESSEFAGNGAGDGYTHGIYVNRIANLTVRDSYFHDTPVGHLLKSRAAETVIENSRFEDGPDGTASRQIDLPNGGQAVIRDSVLYKAADASQGDMIGFGLEGNLHAARELSIEGTTFESDRAGGLSRGVRNSDATMVGFGDGNGFDGVDIIATGPHQFESNIGTDPGSDPAVELVVGDDAVAVAEGGGTGNLVSELLTNDTGGSGAPTVAAVDTSGTKGTVQFDAAAQTLTYTADEADFGSLGVGQTGSDSFAYILSDGTASNTGTVAVEVQGENDAPTVGIQLSDQSAEQDQPFTYTLPSDAFRDPDASDALALTVDGLPTGLSFDGTTISGVPNASGTFALGVTATDPHGAAAAHAFDLAIASVVPGPQGADPLFTETADVVDLDQVAPGTVDPTTTMDALGGNDLVTLGSAFNDVYRAEPFLAGAGADTVTGRSLDDWIDGGAHPDVLSGGGGNDTLIGGGYGDWIDGGPGSDTLIGGSGSDTLIGGGGDDLLIGSRGSDVFLFGKDSGGIDYIGNFRSGGTDVIRLWDVLGPAGKPVAEFSDLDTDGSGRLDGNDAHATQEVSGLTLDFGFGSVAVVNVSALVASDFDIAATTVNA